MQDAIEQQQRLERLRTVLEVLNEDSDMSEPARCALIEQALTDADIAAEDGKMMLKRAQQAA